MEPNGSLPCLQGLATDLYSKPDENIQYIPTQFL